MKRSELEKFIEEEIYKMMAERTILSRNPPRKMTPTQIDRRDKIGKNMKDNQKTVARIKKKYGTKDWESYLWMFATNAAIRGGE